MSFQHLSNSHIGQYPLLDSPSRPNSQSWEVVVDPDVTLSQPEAQSTQPRAQAGNPAEPRSQPHGSQQPRNHTAPHMTENVAKATPDQANYEEVKESEEELAARYARVGIKPRPKTDNRLRFKVLIARINRRQWNMLPDSIHGRLTYNGHNITLFEFIQHLRQEFPPKSNITAEIATILGGKIPASEKMVEWADGGGPVGARLGVTVVVVDGMALPSTSQSTIQYTRHMFAYFTKGKLSELSDISDENKRLRQDSKLQTPVPSLRPPPPRVSIDLRAFYKDYITAINSSKGGPEVGAFCKPSGVVWNGSKKTVPEYCLLMRDAFDAMPDLEFDAHTILVDEDLQQIAVRIDFSGTPMKPFGGGIPNGKPVAFCEHAFYWLEQGKISDVLTIVDWEKYRAQLMC